MTHSPTTVELLLSSPLATPRSAMVYSSSRGGPPTWQCNLYYEDVAVAGVRYM
jgi:hypothetical protein